MEPLIDISRGDCSCHFWKKFRMSKNALFHPNGKVLFTMSQLLFAFFGHFSPQPTQQPSRTEDLILSQQMESKIEQKPLSP